MSFNPVKQLDEAVSIQSNQTRETSTSYTASSRNRSKSDEILKGFQSVRQALLQTSSMIDDIDSFLEQSKNL